jgi:hypothetical protein
MEFRRFVVNTVSSASAGRITLRDGVIRFPTTGTTQPSLQNNTQLAVLGGENHVYGRVTNATNADIVATNHSTVFFHHDVTSQGTITVAAGSTAIFLEDLFSNAGTLLADLGSAEGYGHAEVYGEAQLAGASLEVGLASGFVPSVGDSFVLLSAAGGITGTPTLATPNPSNLLKWDLDVDANQVTVSALPAVDGDYNVNGIVDAADYVIFRKLQGRTGRGLAADSDDNNVVNTADYDTWRNNFGRMVSPAAGGLAAVPEPSVAAPMCIGAAISLSRRRKLH